MAVASVLLFICGLVDDRGLGGARCTTARNVPFW
jgi:hypothetical protein